MIDLYSDTVTQPTEGMYAAITSARLGDDQRGDDPTARDFEERVAEVLGKPAALIVPTATMANQIAIMLHCPPGTEVLCHRTAHVYNYEGGGLAANAGAQAVALSGERGVFSGVEVRAHLRAMDPHFPRSRAVVVENTSNLGGGTVWPDDAFEAVVEVCQEHELKLHLDGARLFNAAIARNRSPRHWSEAADTVQVCFSKGLGCPFGAVIAGSEALIVEARNLRQRLGGALRQAGVMAAAMNYALDHNVKRLERDHERLARLAEALGRLEELELSPFETNILYFSHRLLPAQLFAEQLREKGVWLSHAGGRLRACTHLGIDDADIARAARTIQEVACRRN